MKNLIVVLLVVLGVLFVLSIGFLMGKKFNLMSYRFNNSPAYGFGGRFGIYKRGFERPMRIARGGYAEVVKRNGNKLTLRFSNGFEKEVELSQDTTVYVQTRGSLDDLTEGSKILVKGIEGLDQVIVVEKQ